MRIFLAVFLVLIILPTLCLGNDSVAMSDAVQLRISPVPVQSPDFIRFLELERQLDPVAADTLICRAGEPQVVPGPLGIELVFIPAGDFIMGSDGNLASHDEYPPHKVTISSGFYMARTEITQEQWFAVMGDCHSQFIGLDLPVEKVAWLEIVEFLRRLNAREDAVGVFALPTEQEWEYACRGGSTSEFWWGNGPAEGHCWNRETAGDRTRPVGKTRPNGFGLYDMAGNVSEWCADAFSGYPGSDYEPVQDENPTYVTRGGHWNSRTEDCRSANRSRLWHHYRLAYTGFRVKFTSR